MTWPAGLALAVGLGLALGPTALTAGCGGDDEAAGRTAGPSTTPAGDSDPMEPGRPATTPLPTVGHPDGPPTTPTDQVSIRTLRGTLATSAGCLVLDSQSGRWALEGSLAEGLVAGDRVEVRARPAPQAESPCGAPVLRIVAVRAL
jgi:hypothetical protein